MYKIIYSKKVQKDLKNINEYIANDSPLDAIKTIESIFSTIILLEKFPYLGKEADSILREIVETKYKYKIVYRVKGKEVLILSIYKHKDSWK